MARNPVSSDESQGSSLPLSGVRVLDFTRILAGPYCTLLLADLGADVVKVERSDGGDDTRRWGPPFLNEDDGISAYFAAINRGKRSIAVDLKTEAGRSLVSRLASHFDVAVENFPSPVAERLGVDHSALSRLNPSIVTCSITGYGSGIEYSNRPASELVIEAICGHMQMTGSPGGPPVRYGTAMVDIATGLTAATNILASVMAARMSGKGRHLEVSLFATAMATLATTIAAFTASGREPERAGSEHPSISPYGAFETADGYIVTGVFGDDRWLAFCTALHLDEMATLDRFSSNPLRVRHRQELESRIATQCRMHTTAYWIDRIQSYGILAAPVQGIAQALADPVLAALGIVQPLGSYPEVSVPGLSGAPPAARLLEVPTLGQHTTEVLAQLGLLDLLPDDNAVATVTEN